MKVPIAYSKRTKKPIGISYEEYGMPYTEFVDERGEIKSIFEGEPKRKTPLPLTVNVKFLHETKLLRNPHILPFLPFFQDLPKSYVYRKPKPIENIEIERLIIGGGTSGIATLDSKSLLITRELFGDIIFDISPSPFLEKNEIIKRLKEKVKENEQRVLYGNYIGKFDEGILVELRDKFLLVNAKKVVVSTGARTLKPIFNGNWEPGIVSREFYLKKLGPEKNGKILVLGFNDLAAKTALNANNAIILAPKHIEFSFSPYFRELIEEKGIEIKRDYITEVKSTNQKIVVNTESNTYEVSLVVFSTLKQPRIEVTSSMGIPYTYEGHLYKPIKTNSGVDFTGGTLGIVDEYLSFLSGEALNNPDKLEEFKKLHYTEAQNNSLSESPYYYGSKGVVCECEEVYLEDIEYAKSLGMRDTEEVKRVTGLGTGKCQGKACVITSADYMKSPVLISFRTPIYPVRL
ncbi:(2Fe-2S)-binding protein [Stygiolobus caldivivus]|uniref:(2Fe-2S)-binding protein n=1 Tax=Stygiolobus caldivivus TaxID=2824673 RepID=A0A8D5U7G3_9CREN|nr:(2Fe-2S)-binding protein [Stygiolobus caldivivus]BCU70387.1 (2Fe-2S)-binding protein [Stygiolobus caldivivus]